MKVGSIYVCVMWVLSLLICVFNFILETQTSDDVAQVIFNLVIRKQESTRVTDVPFNIGTDYNRYGYLCYCGCIKCVFNVYLNVYMY